MGSIIDGVGGIEDSNSGITSSRGQRLTEG